MTNDKLVFDIETKNSFADVGGRGNLRDLEVSVVGVYSYDLDKYMVFDEDELDDLGEMLKRSRILIGFSSKTFDVPVLEKYFNFKLSAIPHFDILEEVEASFGRKIGLGHLGEANLGIKKTGHGMEAIGMYERGEMERLKEYCLQDVKITKELLDRIVSRGYLWVPRRDIPQMAKVDIKYIEPDTSQAQLI